MTDTFMRLRPYGDGYSVVETGRNDSPMNLVRVFVGGISVDSLEIFDIDTEVSYTNVVAIIAGILISDPDQPWYQSLYMDKNTETGTWHIIGTLVEESSFGTNDFIDVLFIHRGFVTESTLDATPDL